MKLLVCTTEYPPTFSSGIGNVAFEVVEQLKKKDIECIVCAPNADIKLGSSSMIAKYGRIGVYFYWYKVSHHFKKNEYDMVWLHQPLFLTNNPFSEALITVHTSLWEYSKVIQNLKYPIKFKIYYKITSIIEKYCLKKVSKYNNIDFTGVNSTVCRELKEIGIDEEKISHIPNGVDISKFKPMNNKQVVRNKFNIQHDHIVFLSVGRLSHMKKIFTTLDCFKILQENIKKCSLVIVGNGELKEALINYINIEKINNVSVMGFIPHEELMPFYACADYYIMTSEYEGQPLTLLEAMASGLPCIVSDIPNLRIVEDADCGIIVDFSDKEKAAHKIIDYVKQDNSEHGKNARKYAEEYLDWSIIAEKYLRQLENIL